MKNFLEVEHIAATSQTIQKQQSNKFSREGIPVEYISCPGCGEDDYCSYAEYRDIDYGTPGLWSLVCCKNCNLIYLNPRPTADAFPLIYPPNYVPYQMKLGPDTRWLMKYAIMKAYEGTKLKLIAKAGLPENARILDVGCGAGFFLALLKRRGWTPVGVEPNGDLVKRATRELGLDVRLGTLTTVNLEPNSFDAITLWHCLEHDPAPKDTLHHCYRLLKPGGVIITQVPDNESWEAQTLKNRFWNNDLPRHLIFFTSSTLARLAQKSGFVITDIRRAKNATSWLWSFLRWIKWDLYAQMEKNITKITALYILIAPFYYLISKGDWITGIFKKEK